MIMRKVSILIILVVLTIVSACEKVWEADLREKALDSIRGIYEIESATWEGQEPLDIYCDGNGTFDYLSEYLSIDVGAGDFTSYIKNETGFINIPIIRDSNNGFHDPVRLIRDFEQYRAKINVIIEGNSSRVEVAFNEAHEDIEFRQTGYGGFSMRKEITMTDCQGRTSTAPVTFKFKRTGYLGK